MNKHQATIITAVITSVGVVLAALITALTPILVTSTTQPPTQTTPTSSQLNSTTKVLPTPTKVENTSLLEQTTPQFVDLSPISPRFFNFKACPDLCNGSNEKLTFPEGTKHINVQWSYENVPLGSLYVRSWSLDGNTWIRYSCRWDEASTGSDSVNLKEPKGLHSGTWIVTITVNGQEFLRETIVVEGNETYWDPGGEKYTCH